MGGRVGHGKEEGEGTKIERENEERDDKRKS